MYVASTTARFQTAFTIGLQTHDTNLVCEQGKYTVRVNARPMDYQFVADSEY
jgi:hypothetical protein